MAHQGEGFWFRSDLFDAEPGEDEQTNPRRYGKKPAEWLRSRFTALGYDVEAVIPEDWGWCVMCQRDPYALWIGCGNLVDYEYAREGDPPPPKKLLLWNVFATAEVPFFKYLFRSRPDTAAGLEKLTDPASFLDTYISSRHGDRKGGWLSKRRGLAAAIALLALLVVQMVHYSRESLATTGAFKQTIAPLYRLFGEPVTPSWNIKGWQFEATNGSVDDNEELLTIYSRIANKYSDPLPYPLVHVSINDRWEEIIGSRVLEPNEYLTGKLDPSKLVAPGNVFTAVITIESPSENATGFKLNVCYRLTPDRVRCAIDDFKN